jgi:hypothetical protein
MKRLLDVFETGDRSIEPFVNPIEPSIHAISQTADARIELAVSFVCLVEQRFCPFNQQREMSFQSLNIGLCGRKVFGRCHSNQATGSSYGSASRLLTKFLTGRHLIVT